MKKNIIKLKSFENIINKHSSFSKKNAEWHVIIWKIINFKFLTGMFLVASLSSSLTSNSQIFPGTEPMISVGEETKPLFEESTYYLA